MNAAVMSIAVTEARNACKGESDILERIRKAMRVCHNHWMVTGEAQQLNSALAGAMLESEGEERDRIGRSGKAFNRANIALAAMVSGVPVDIEAMEAELASEPVDDIIPIAQLWRETK